MKNIVHIVGTGTIGEPLIGLFSDFGTRMGVDEVTFHKRTPLVSDRAKLEHLMARGAKLAVDDDVRKEFQDLGHTVSFGEHGDGRRREVGKNVNRHRDGDIPPTREHAERHEQRDHSVVQGPGNDPVHEATPLVSEHGRRPISHLCSAKRA